MKSCILLVLLAQIVTVLCQSYADIIPVNLKCEYLRNPLSVDSPNPRLSWTFKPSDPNKKNLTQKAYQIIVSTDEQKLAKNVGDLWDTKKVVSDRNNHIRYEGKPLASGQTAYWKVKVWDQNDKESSFDYEPAHFGKGLQTKEWTAEWVGAPKDTQKKALVNLQDIDAKLVKEKAGLVPVLYLRKQFAANQQIKSAKLFATAQGAYKIRINGENFQNQELAPGWTDFHQTIEYHTYDVKKLLTQNNVITVLLGTGWYGSYIGFSHQYNHYGTDQSFLMELHIEYNNGTKVLVKTDNTWKVTTGPIIYSDMLMGELYYEDRELKGYETTSYDDKNWLPVVTKPIDKNVELSAQIAEPIVIAETLRPKTIYQSSPGVWVMDFEQNMVGWVEIRIRGQGRVQIRHAEVLNPDGTIYTKNLRSALATDTYVVKSNGLTLEPHFTFHGFRYIEITGYAGEPQLEDVVGKVIHSNIPFVGHIQTSNKMVNRLHLNTVWGQKGNFISVPTDCPQRDERLGWAGDGEVFAPTATYNADVAAFYTKWTRDLREGQSKDGGFPDVGPRLVDQADGSPAWGDAGVIVPYYVYKMYGDVKIIEDNYEAMTKWIDYIWKANPNLIWTKRVNNNFGDWLSLNADTPKDLLATAYFGYDVLLLSRMAAAVNKKEDAQKYQSLFANISAAFNKAYVDQSTGKIKGDTQTAYLVSLAFELLPEKLRSVAAQHLADNVKAHDWHLTTGFVGVGYLCPILTQYGHNDVAYRLLLQDTYPSWGYSIKYNATTIWERWDGWTKEKGFQDPGMNSFNHYSLGSVGRWLFQSVAGIDQNDDSIGFKKILIRPKPGNGLTFVNSSYESINGLIGTSWTTDNKTFTLKTSIPINTRATIDLRVYKNGGVHEVGSGDYEFTVKIN